MGFISTDFLSDKNLRFSTNVCNMTQDTRTLLYGALYMKSCNYGFTGVTY